jgi:hypothetical protein
MRISEAKEKVCPFLQVNGTNQKCIAGECMAWELIGPNTGKCLRLEVRK